MQSPNVFELFLYIGRSQIDTLHSAFEIARGMKEGEKAGASVTLLCAVCFLQKWRCLSFNTELAQDSKTALLTVQGNVLKLSLKSQLSFPLPCPFCSSKSQLYLSVFNTNTCSCLSYSLIFYPPKQR